MPKAASKQKETTKAATRASNIFTDEQIVRKCYKCSKLSEDDVLRTNWRACETSSCQN